MALVLSAALLVAGLVAVAARYGDSGPSRPAQTAPQVVAAPDEVAREYPARNAGSPVPRTGMASVAAAAGDAAAATRPDTTTGIAVHDRATGETAVGTAGAVPMYSASLVKLIVVIDMLERDAGPPLTPRDVDLIRRALGPSDDEAMNVLWSRFDGAGAVARVAGRLGLTETRAPQDPAQWGETVLSARDMAALYEHVLKRMPAADENLIMDALAAAPARATDGFDQAFGLLAGERVAAKQGWMCCLDGRIHMHSAGIADPGARYVVAILSSAPSGAGYAEARATVTAVADAVRAPLR